MHYCPRSYFSWKLTVLNGVHRALYFNNVQGRLFWGEDQIFHLQVTFMWMNSAPKNMNFKHQYRVSLNCCHTYVFPLKVRDGKTLNISAMWEKITCSEIKHIIKKRHKGKKEGKKKSNTFVSMTFWGVTL